MNITIDHLLDLQNSDYRDIFKDCIYPWEVLDKIHSFLKEIGGNLNGDYERIGEYIWVGKGTRIEDHAFVKGPAILGRDCEIRHGAYIRENVLIGDQVVVGNSTEIKNSILFNGVQVPHFNYVGDSVLGYRAHLGAGVKLSNVKSTGGKIKVISDGRTIETELKKFGAILGDHAEVGCNAVLNPGTILGRYSIIYPLTLVRGSIPERHILKNTGELAKRDL